MRVKISLLLVALAGIAGAQVWEKPIAPGLVYRMEVDSATPRVIHALRFTPGSPTKAMVDLAGKTVYEENAAKGGGTVSSMVLEQGALAGLNGDFFPYTGDPLGAMVRSGELLSVPSVPRASFGWSNIEGAGAFGIMSFRGSFQANGSEVQIDNINGNCPANGVTLNTEVAAFSLCKVPNVHVVVKLDRADFSPNGTSTATVQGMTADTATYQVPGGCAVLVAQGNKVTQLTGLRQGDRVVFRFQADGIDWRKVDQLISGGPFLMKDGNVWVDAEAEKFKDDFTKQRHPRTAVGRTASGDFWFVTVDGRQSMSQGATIRELADLMMRLGCRDAINLDGGGSTNLNVFGVNVNRPSDGVERPVANGIFFFGPRPLKSSDPVTIDGPPTLDIKGTATLRAMEGSKPVADADVIWSAQGGAWIDQGGLLKPLKNGPATITAWVRGNVITKQIFVTGVATKPRSTPVTSRGGDRKGAKKGGGGRH